MDVLTTVTTTRTIPRPMPGYRPPSSEPRGKWAKRIHEKRRADDISQQQAFELLHAKLGLRPKSRAAYAALDMGSRQPRAHEEAVLAEWLGGYPSDDMDGSGADDTPQPDLSALITALAAQTVAITALAEQVRSLVDAQPATTEVATALVELVRSGLLGPSPVGAPAAPTPID